MPCVARRSTTTRRDAARKNTRAHAHAQRALIVLAHSTALPGPPNPPTQKTTEAKSFHATPAPAASSTAPATAPTTAPAAPLSTKKGVRSIKKQRQSLGVALAVAEAFRTQCTKEEPAPAPTPTAAAAEAEAEVPVVRKMSAGMLAGIQVQRNTSSSRRRGEGGAAVWVYLLLSTHSHTRPTRPPAHPPTYPPPIRLTRCLLRPRRPRPRPCPPLRLRTVLRPPCQRI